MKKKVLERIRKEFQVGSEDIDEIVFTGQRIRWKGKALVIDQDKAIEELSEIQFELVAATAEELLPPLLANVVGIGNPAVGAD